VSTYLASEYSPIQKSALELGFYCLLGNQCSSACANWQAKVVGLTVAELGAFTANGVMSVVNTVGGVVGGVANTVGNVVGGINAGLGIHL
jgi:hypothetical protein